MRVDYQKDKKLWYFLRYNQFSIGSTSEEYPLTVGGFTGEYENWFDQHDMLNGMKFTALDNDNDQRNNYNCVFGYRSGWWYNSCTRFNINTQPPQIPSGSRDVQTIFSTEILRIALNSKL